MPKRSTTSRQIGRRFGHSDDDLTTPGHDALVLWCRDHAQDLLEMYITPRLRQLHDQTIAEFRDSEKKRFAAEVTRHETELVRAKEIVRDCGASAYVPAARPPVPVRTVPKYNNDPKHDHWLARSKPILEKPISGGWIDVFISGYFNSHILPNHTWHAMNWCLAIEVKTSIRSLGELLRQLRIYQQFTQVSYHEHGHVSVVSPDGRFAADLEHQGFLFYKPQPEARVRVEL
jgi:hypothetical protein